jgi:hypothetical protein
MRRRISRVLRRRGSLAVAAGRNPDGLQRVVRTKAGLRVCVRSMPLGTSSGVLLRKREQRLNLAPQ